MKKTITQKGTYKPTAKPYQAKQTVKGKFPMARKLVVNQVMKNNKPGVAEQSAKIKRA